MLKKFVFPGIRR